MGRCVNHAVLSAALCTGTEKTVPVFGYTVRIAQNEAHIVTYYSIGYGTKDVLEFGERVEGVSEAERARAPAGVEELALVLLSRTVAFVGLRLPQVDRLAP